MANSEPLTRYIGEAERTLQALLQTQLQQAGISFAEWAVLTFLNHAERLKRSHLVETIKNGRVIESKGIDGLLDAMVSKGLIEQLQTDLAITAAARMLYEPLRTKVMKITTLLERDIPAEDLRATRRTLAIVSERAGKVLADMHAPT